MKRLSIGQVAQRAEVKIETIRYYERIRLLKEPQRSLSGYRQYSGDVIKRLYFIKNAKELGFSLKEISELLSLKVNAKSTCSTVKKKADKKVEEINDKIKTLQKMKRNLLKLSKTCRGDSRLVSECPILDDFGSMKG
ncbi:hypothetical protein MNBD_BACTEROID05-982 [hydrothermal vent metagenome]|uniref:HTH merR-type domain-containing protein n=1 Tax=hydrothermal vent metagenome TaxID=652676 RepID=A0A3B0SYT7_9ZZZZ